MSKNTVPIKINICSVGEPTSPSTWSGTVFNLYTAFLKIDKLNRTFNSSVTLHPFFQKLFIRFNVLFYQTSIDIGRGRFYRYLFAWRVKRQTQQSGSKHTLHTGTFDLPFLRLPKNQAHYLYCDSTWNLWKNSSTNICRDSERILKDAERLELKAYQQMRHIFPISEYVKQNLIEQYGISADKITVAGTGLGIIKPFHGIKNYSNGKILFAAKGRFKDKGGDLVLEAFQIAVKSNPHLSLTIVGQNEYTHQIDLPNVTTHGFISIEELQNLFNEHSLFLMPAENEPWGLVYLEAMACKMPIVGLNKNSFPEISRNGEFGYMLNESKPEYLAEILVSAFSEPSKLRETGLRAQEFCLNKFSWIQTATTIANKIESLEG